MQKSSLLQLPEGLIEGGIEAGVILQTSLLLAPINAIADRAEQSNKHEDEEREKK